MPFYVLQTCIPWQKAKIPRVNPLILAVLPGHIPGQVHIPGNITGIERYLNCLALQFIELSVNQHPSLILCVPVFSDNMVSVTNLNIGIEMFLSIEDIVQFTGGRKPRWTM